jgi:hypothetical protein
LSQGLDVVARESRDLAVTCSPRRVRCWKRASAAKIPVTVLVRFWNVLSGSIWLDFDVRLPPGHHSADWLGVAIVKFVRDLLRVLALEPEHKDCHFMRFGLFRDWHSF